MTPDAIKADYDRMLEERGELIAIRRYTGTGSDRPKFDTEVRAVVLGYTAEQLQGDIQQGDQKLIVLAQDLIDRQFPTPVQQNDKVVVRGKELNVEDPDDNTRRVAGVLIAYELRVRG